MDGWLELDGWMSLSKKNVEMGMGMGIVKIINGSLGWVSAFERGYEGEV